MANRWPGRNWTFLSNLFLIVSNASGTTGTIFVLTLHILLTSVSRSLYLLSFIIIIIISTTPTTTTINSQHFSWFSKSKGYSLSTSSITLLKTYCFRIRIYSAGWRLSSFKLPCTLFGMILIMDNANGTINWLLLLLLLKSFL